MPETYRPAPGRYRLVPDPEWDMPPVFVTVDPDADELERDDLPEAVYAWDGEVFMRTLETETGPLQVGYVCYGGRYRHYSQRPGFPSLTLDEGSCEPTA